MAADVTLSSLTRVPKMKNATVRQLMLRSRVSAFTIEALKFTAAYRGKNVRNYLEALQAHMEGMIVRDRIRRNDGLAYSLTSVHSLTRKALVYTEL